ncbi:potassium channel family protein, partial [Opitutales bacterium]|nr:potassium channel family protein [Opitutales bacterium]
MPSIFRERNRRKNVTRLLKLFVILAVFVVLYMNLYRSIMGDERNDAYIGWVESLYWVLTTMSTLGYGDITFSGNTGRLFSMAVMFT